MPLREARLWAELESAEKIRRCFTLLAVAIPLTALPPWTAMRWLTSTFSVFVSYRGWERARPPFCMFPVGVQGAAVSVYVE
ncbi:hypothetical protein D3C72_2046830 [compost metagenome]